MKIVHLIGFFQPEFGYQEYYLSKRQAAMGHDVHIITSDYIYPFKNVEAMLRDVGSSETSRKRGVGEETIDGVRVHRLRSFLRYGDFILSWGVKRALREIRPDVVIAHEAKQGIPLFGARYKKMLGYKLIYNIHDFFHKIPNHSWWKRILRYIDYFWFRILLVRSALKKADAVIAPVDEIKNFLIERHGVNADRIHSIPLAVETDLFSRNAGSREGVRSKYGVGEKDVVITFAGHIDRRKNIELLLETFDRLRNEKPVHLFIVGSGDTNYLNQLKALADSKLSKKFIHFMGHSSKPEIINFYSASDIAVWPGNNSISIMEAMACNLPVVAVNLQLGYLITRDTGFTFEAEEPESFKKYIRKMIDDPAMRESMGKCAREKIIDKYSEENRVRQITALAGELL